MSKYAGRIERWRVVEDWHGTGYSVIVGTIYNHRSFPSGGPIRTSNIVELDEEKMEVTTRNSLYKLGERLERN